VVLQHLPAGVVEGPDGISNQDLALGLLVAADESQPILDAGEFEALELDAEIRMAARFESRCCGLKIGRCGSEGDHEW
jgi:hypothetical protein